MYNSSNTYGIQMTNNISISKSGIVISYSTLYLLDYNPYALIYKGSSGVVDSLRIINNRIMGGFYGIYWYGGNSCSVYGTNICRQ